MNRPAHHAPAHEPVQIETLRCLLDYYPENGDLVWKPRSPGMFTGGKQSAEQNCAIWNGRYAGKIATSIGNRGYCRVKIFDRDYQSHRVIWAFVHGQWPINDIDHINGIRTDNRIVNLRAVTRSENNCNQRCGVRNTSGVIGVSWDKGTNKWRAQIAINRRGYHLGLFRSLGDAITARKVAEQHFGFHPNQGRHTVQGGAQ